MPWHRTQLLAPVARARQLRDSSIFGKIFQEILAGRQLAHDWQHQLREKWRLHALAIVSRDRAQHFGGVRNNIQRELTCSLLRQWTEQADQLQCLIDSGLQTNPDPNKDPRVRLKVLRLLLVGGLMNPDKDARHRRKGQAVCACGGTPTVEHISCTCPKFATLRQPAIANLPCATSALPICFRSCTTVPHSMRIGINALHAIQSALVDVWQAHITEWTQASDDATMAPNQPGDERPPERSADAQPQQARPVERKGHVLHSTASGRTFCVKCGRQTQYPKHVRSKILKTPCPFPNLPEAEWLSEPGRMQSASCLDEQERKLRQDHNQGNHTIHWNRQTGKGRRKANYGEIYCSRCGRRWGWMCRHNNFRRTECFENSDALNPPSWFQRNEDVSAAAPAAQPAHVHDPRVSERPVNNDPTVPPLITRPLACSPEHEGASGTRLALCMHQVRPRSATRHLIGATTHCSQSREHLFRTESFLRARETFPVWGSVEGAFQRGGGTCAPSLRQATSTFGIRLVLRPTEASRTSSVAARLRSSTAASRCLPRGDPPEHGLPPASAR